MWNVAERVVTEQPYNRRCGGHVTSIDTKLVEMPEPPPMDAYTQNTQENHIGAKGEMKPGEASSLVLGPLSQGTQAQA